jgi:hypothetical protein
VNIVTLVDFGKTAAENLYGLPGWDSVSMDRYMGNVDLGPGGTKMTTGGTGDYNHQLVTGPARQFTEDEIIVVTWYNAVDSPTTFTSTMSFDDPDRPISGTTGTWHAMTQVTVPPKSTSETRLALTGIAGSYTLVSVSHRHPNGAHILCDKIELLTQAGSSVTDRAVGHGTLAISASPNPFKTSIKIAVSGQQIADSKIGVSIYNIKGKIISKLSATSYQLSAGITWNASACPAGVYFLKATMGDKVYSKKLFLQK